MLRVLIHEWVTGGGLAGSALPESWAAEGHAMRRAAEADWGSLQGVEVVTTRDERFGGNGGRSAAVGPGGHDGVLAAESARADYTVLIAPETGGVLEACTRLVGRCGGRSLGATAEAVALSADKLRLAGHLRGLGIRTPLTLAIDPEAGPPRHFPYPAVVKPVDGAGSLRTYYLGGPEDAPWGGWRLPTGMVIQPYEPGEALSASVLIGPSGAARLVGVGRQRVRVVGGRFRYDGGRLPEPPEWALGDPLRAALGVDGLRGLVGVDFVREPSTGRVTVIEINPRPTTSYVGLASVLTGGALARAWLETWQAPGPTVDPRGMIAPGAGPAVEFSADGATTVDGDHE